MIPNNHNRYTKNTTPYIRKGVPGTVNKFDAGGDVGAPLQVIGPGTIKDTTSSAPIQSLTPGESVSQSLREKKK